MPSPPQPPPSLALLFEMLDLCTGVGCFPIGLKSIIMHVLAYCELSDEAVAVLQSLILCGKLPKPESSVPIFPDVRKLLQTPAFKKLMACNSRDDPALRLLPLLVCAGWPCQVRARLPCLRAL